jgi:antibiotic biosynthesis monooxygenase (ABM) superfamily enzyme
MEARPDMVAAVVLHRVAAGMRTRYEHWLERLIPVAATFHGHRGVDVVRPAEGSSTYTVAIRFDDLEGAQAWLASRARQSLAEEVEPLLAEAGQSRPVTGLEFWFDAGGTRKPPWRFRQFLLTLSVLHPLTLLVPPAVHAVTGGLPRLQVRWIEALIVTSVIAALLTWVVLPAGSRRVSAWLRR